LFLAVLATALSVGAVSARRVQAATSPANPAYAVQNAIVHAASAIQPSVVNIDTTAEVRMQRSDVFPQQEGEAKGSGSGVIISKDGLILTNEHVVHGASSITVTLADHRKFKGVVKGADRLSDIALVKIDAHDLPAATLGNSDAIPIGAFVIAVGNPLGFQHTMTFGILSGKGREIPESGKEFRNLLQTDAAINPGNSGGPLVDLDGRVVGINTAIIRQAQGLGFAIPINTARQVAQQLETVGKIVRPYIGVMMESVTDDIAQLLRLPKTEGVVVDRVLPKSPAAAAGLSRGDVILAVDGTPISNAESLQNSIRAHKIGDRVSLRVWSNAKLKTLSLRVEEMPQG
jgi:serine protease Do